MRFVYDFCLIQYCNYIILILGILIILCRCRLAGTHLLRNECRYYVLLKAFLPPLLPSGRHILQHDAPASRRVRDRRSAAFRESLPDVTGRSGTVTTPRPPAGTSAAAPPGSPAKRPVRRRRRRARQTDRPRGLRLDTPTLPELRRPDRCIPPDQFMWCRT
jgi:hypothetical protein